MITLDACLLLEFLRSFTGEKSKTKSKFFEQHHGSAILRDIVKLQNQIPLIVLIKLLELETKSDQNAAEEKLLDMLYFGAVRMCYPFSPSSIKWTSELKSKLLGKAHILDLLSSIIVESFSEQESVPNSHNESQQNRQQEDTCRWHNLITKVGGSVRKKMDPNGCSWQSSLPSVVVLKRTGIGIKFKLYRNGLNKVEF
eukprot:Gb_06307 [translate_table: standard]